MTERKRDHFATIMTILLIAAVAVGVLAPALAVAIAEVLAVVSLPVVIWNITRTSL